jgi:hypothetical protein
LQIIDRTFKFGTFGKLLANAIKSIVSELLLLLHISRAIYSKLLNWIEESFENKGKSLWKRILSILSSKEFKEENDCIGIYKVSSAPLLIRIFFKADIELLSSMYK